MKYKNAQIGATLTWFMAFIIIFFIIMTFIYFSSAIGAKKQVGNLFFSGDKMAGLEALSEEAVMSSSLFAILESKTEVNGTNLKFLDLITEYDDYDHENQLLIKNKLKIELDKLCDSYEFNVRDIVIANVLIVNPTRELMLPLNDNSELIPIRYTQARSCQ